MIRKNQAIKEELAILYDNYKKNRKKREDADKIIYVSITTNNSLKGIVKNNELPYFKGRKKQLKKENKKSGGFLFNKIKHSLQKKNYQSEEGKEKQIFKKLRRFFSGKLNGHKADGNGLHKQSLIRNKKSNLYIVHFN